jgi:hypothetical protein
VLGIPLLILGLVFFGKIRAVVFFFIVALTVGLGYLTSTGAVQDIGRNALEYAEKYTGPASSDAPSADETPPERPANPVTTVPDTP